MVRVHQRLDQRGGKIFENVYGLAAAWPWTFANVYRGCMGHVRLSDSAGAQPSHEHHVTGRALVLVFQALPISLWRAGSKTVKIRRCTFTPDPHFPPSSSLSHQPSPSRSRMAPATQSTDEYAFDIQLDTGTEDRGFHGSNKDGEIQRPDVVDDICQGLLLQ